MENTFISKAKTLQIMRKKLWTPARNKPYTMGSVTDIKLFDKGKLVDYQKGGDNAISGGGSFQLMRWAFDPQKNGTTYTDRYFDGVNYFPNTTDGNQVVVPTAQSSWTNSPDKWLFGSLAGISGGTAGLQGKSTLSNIKIPWVMKWFHTQNGWTVGDDFTLSPASTYVTKTITPSQSTSGTPIFSWNVTITSSATAHAYSLDSVGWIPVVIPAIAGAGNCFSLNATNPATILNTGQAFPTSDAVAGAGTTISTYLSALFALPYLITVNPGGAFQFTYTFQGSN